VLLLECSPIDVCQSSRTQQQQQQQGQQQQQQQQQQQVTRHAYSSLLSPLNHTHTHTLSLLLFILYTSYITKQQQPQ